jgi:hypothetical protein
MIDYILEKFTDITSKCLERNAKENGCTKKDMQLVFKLGSSGEAEYLIYKQYQPIRVLSFLEVLGVKLDFKGYSLFVPNFIKGALNRFCEEHKIATENVRILLSFDEKDRMVLWLYSSNQYVKQFQLEELFDSQDILQEQ